MRELIRAMQTTVPANVREVSEGLQYRDFITVGLLVDRLKVKEPDGGLLKDTWIYVQEPDVSARPPADLQQLEPLPGRDPNKVWIGLEYFCYDTDPLWKMPDDDLKRFAIAESREDRHPRRRRRHRRPRGPRAQDLPCLLRHLRPLRRAAGVHRPIENLFLVGRNGMHKYNNQDHSMLTAMHVVDGLATGSRRQAALWEINTEQEYHEHKDKEKLASA